MIGELCPSVKLLTSLISKLLIVPSYTRSLVLDIIAIYLIVSYFLQRNKSLNAGSSLLRIGIDQKSTGEEVFITIKSSFK